MATLDGLRGVAALSVACMHMSTDTPLGAFPRRSYLSVDFFFVLSGYVVAKAYESRLLGGLSFGGFARIRIIRLYPLILLCALVEFFVQIGPHLKASPPFLQVDSGFLLAFLSCALVFPYPYMGGKGNLMLFPIDPPIWSLMFEILANFVYAASVRILTTTILSILVSIGAVALWITAIKYNGVEAGFWTGTIWGGWARVGFSFFCGVLIFRTMSAERIQKLPRVPASVLIGALVLTFSIKPAVGGWLFDVAAVLVIYPALVVLSLTETISEGLRRWALIGGALSYPVYILHKPIEERLWPTISEWPIFRNFQGAMILVPFTLELAVILGGSYAVLRLYDAPVRRWLSGRSSGHN